jgi:hypothetical protein
MEQETKLLGGALGPYDDTPTLAQVFRSICIAALSLFLSLPALGHSKPPGLLTRATRNKAKLAASLKLFWISLALFHAESPPAN